MAPALSDNLVVSSRPRFVVDGQEEDRLAVDLLELDVWHREEGLSALEARLLAWGATREDAAPDLLYQDGRILDLGKRLEVWAGDDDNRARIFDGTITALQLSTPGRDAPHVRIFAEDALQWARMRQHARIHEDADDGDMVEDVARESGLRPEVSATGVQHTALWQVNQSDLAFLRERARAADARLEVRDGTLVFAGRREDDGLPPIDLSRLSELLSFEVRADLAHQRTAVRVHGWSVADKAAIHEEAGQEVARAEASGRRTGPAVLSELGIDAIEDHHLEAPATTEEARQTAEALARTRARRFVVGSGTLDATPGLRVGNKLDIVDVGPLFSGVYHVTRVHHSFDQDRGFRTHFEAERPELGAGMIVDDRSRLVGVYPAEVVDVVDPDDQGRVRVRLPFLPEDEGERATAWARLATLMAGADRGTWFIPEVGDEVLVSFLAGDPRHPIVVGALWNGGDAPPETMDGAGNNDLRSITSRSGHKLTFDDTQGAEKVEVVTQGGHTVDLDDGGRTITVEHSGGARVEIDAAGNISVTAIARVTVDAPAGMTITTPMLTVDAAMSRFSGIVQCDTLITNAVVSASYTPGAGNVW